MIVNNSCTKPVLHSTPFKDNTKNTPRKFYQQGIASWYGKKFHNRRTANTELYNMFRLTAAHKQLPFNTFVEVLNLANNQRVIVRINDRGPFIKGRIIDLSYKAAQKIGMDVTGTTEVKLFILNQPSEGLTPSRPESEPRTDPFSKTFYTIQAGAFSIRENALNMLKELNRILPLHKFKIIFTNGLHKVVSADNFLNSKAEQIMKRLKQQGIHAYKKQVFGF